LGLCHADAVTPLPGQCPLIRGFKHKLCSGQLCFTLCGHWQANMLTGKDALGTKLLQALPRELP